jgi:hypothetical protein
VSTIFEKTASPHFRSRQSPLPNGRHENDLVRNALLTEVVLASFSLAYATSSLGPFQLVICVVQLCFFLVLLLRTDIHAAVFEIITEGMGARGAARKRFSVDV